MPEERFQLGGYWLSRRRTSPVWCRTWFEPRSRQTRRCSLGTRDFEQAKVELARWFLQQRQLKEEPADSVSVAELLDRYQTERVPHIVSQDAALRAIVLWKAHYSAKTLSELTRAEQLRFVDYLRAQRVRGQPYSDATISRVLGVGATALQWAVAHEYIASAPRIRSVPVLASKARQRFTLEQMAAFLNACGPTTEHVWRWAVLSINTMARPGAVLELTAGQVDLQDSAIDLNPAGRRQNKKRRPVVPLTSTLLPWVRAFGSGRLVLYRRSKKGDRPVKSIKNGFKRVRKRAGLPADLTPYSIRHTLSRELRRRGVPKWEVAGMLGHVGVGTTEGYALFEPDWRGAAAQAIDAYCAELSALLARPLRASSVSGAEKAGSEEAAKALKVDENAGRRDWDRTSDHFHVKDGTIYIEQDLESPPVRIGDHDKSAG